MNFKKITGILIISFFASFIVNFYSFLSMMDKNGKE